MVARWCPAPRHDKGWVWNGYVEVGGCRRREPPLFQSTVMTATVRAIVLPAEMQQIRVFVQQLILVTPQQFILVTLRHFRLVIGHRGCE